MLLTLRVQALHFIYVSYWLKNEWYFSIRSSDAIGTHYEITLPAAKEMLVKDFPALLEDVCIRLNIHNADISRIVRNILTNYGAEYLT